MVKHQSKCLLEVTKSSSHNPSDRMIEPFTNQTHHNQPSLYQKHMETYCFNTHLNILFLLTSAPLQFENRLLNTTMALSSKIERATRMYILRRYHLPAAAKCLMKKIGAIFIVRVLGTIIQNFGAWRVDLYISSTISICGTWRNILGFGSLVTSPSPTTQPAYGY